MLAHHVAEPLHGQLRTAGFADRAELTNITKQHRHFRVAANQQIRIGRQLAREFRRKELLEANLNFGHDALLVDARATGCHTASQRFDEHRLQLADEIGEHS